MTSTVAATSTASQLSPPGSSSAPLLGGGGGSNVRISVPQLFDGRPAPERTSDFQLFSLAAWVLKFLEVGVDHPKLLDLCDQQPASCAVWLAGRHQKPLQSQWRVVFNSQVGDHILQVNGHPVSTMQQLSEEIRCDFFFFFLCNESAKSCFFRFFVFYICSTYVLHMFYICSTYVICYIQKWLRYILF